MGNYESINKTKTFGLGHFKSWWKGICSYMQYAVFSARGAAVDDKEAQGWHLVLENILCSLFRLHPFPCSLHIVLCTLPILHCTVFIASYTMHAAYFSGSFLESVCKAYKWGLRLWGSHLSRYHICKNHPCVGEKNEFHLKKNHS